MEKKYKKKFFFMCSLIVLLTSSCSNRNENIISQEINIDLDSESAKDIQDRIKQVQVKFIDKTNKKSNATVVENTNIYLGPSNKYEVVSSLEKDNEVIIISKSLENWYLVEYDSKYGFIESKKLNLSNTIIPDCYYDMDGSNVIEATHDVNIRKSSDIKSEKLGLLKYKEQLEILKEVNEWYEVKYRDEIGYVSKHYANVVNKKNLVNNFYKVVCLKEDSKLYADINESSSIDLPRYECGEVFNETENYYLIKTDNTIGYIKKENLLELRDTFVIVDVSDQIMKLYKNNKIALTSDVVTGKDSSPTDMGIEEILFKQKNRTLVGENNSYKTHVNYWMQINNNSEGLHDATWRTNFGGNIYNSSGSHGCVNLPLEVAENLYDEVEVGTRVIVKK